MSISFFTHGSKWLEMMRVMVLAKKNTTDTKISQRGGVNYFSYPVLVMAMLLVLSIIQT